MNAAKTLQGKTVVLTRTPEGDAAARPIFERAGARVLDIPLIAAESVHERLEDEEILAEIAAYDWIVFTSAQGVRGFFARFFRKYDDIRFIGPAKFACVGRAEADALWEYRLATDVRPPEATGAALADAMVQAQTLDNLKILVITGNLNRDALAQRLTKERAIVDTMPVYETREHDVSQCPDAATFRAEGADALVFASPSAVASFRAQAKEFVIAPAAKKPLACAIGPTTASAMRQAGIPVDVEAKDHSMQGLCAALVEKIGA